MGRENAPQGIMDEVGNSCVNCGECCINMFFEGLTAEDLESLSPGNASVTELGTRSQVLDAIFHMPYLDDGVYYAKVSNGTNAVGVKGSCPNLMKDRTCNIYDARPDACRDFPVGGKSCKNARKEAGLKPLGVDARNSKQSVI